MLTISEGSKLLYLAIGVECWLYCDVYVMLEKLGEYMFAGSRVASLDILGV